MSEADLPPRQIDTPSRFRRENFLYRRLPYIAVLVLAILGVAYTNISHQSLVGYWEFLVMVMAVVCIVTQWESAPDKRARFRLIFTQALHWVAILVTMNIVLTSGLRALLPVPATSLVLGVLCTGSVLLVSSTLSARKFASVARTSSSLTA